MKITVNDSIKKVPFAKIGLGECFSDADDDYFIRIEESTTRGMTVNAVEPRSGLTFHFDEDDVVVPLLNSELIIQ